jgi:biopolymer transport protein ExbD
MEGQPVNINLLQTRLEQQLFNKESKVIFIQADESLNYGYVIRVIDIAKRAGVEKVGLITEPPDRKKRRQ